MAEINPYTRFEPGQLITAESMNAMQQRIRDDIAAQIGGAIDALTDIANSENSDKLGGETPEELLNRFLERAMQEITLKSGYRKLFKVLRPDQRNVVEHGMGLCPLVDIYVLEEFPVVCGDDDIRRADQVRFFLYHSSETSIRDADGNSVTIEKSGDTPFRMPVGAILDLFEVEYTGDSSLGDLETELWKAMSAEPNDPIDASEWCHSPWYERCCREERSVDSLKEKGDWDDLWLKIVPRKTAYTIPNPNAVQGQDGDNLIVKPNGILVAHHDLNTLSLTRRVTEPQPGADGVAREEGPAHVMVLLKV